MVAVEAVAVARPGAQAEEEVAMAGMIGDRAKTVYTFETLRSAARATLKEIPWA